MKAAGDGFIGKWTVKNKLGTGRFDRPVKQ